MNNIMELVDAYAYEYRWNADQSSAELRAALAAEVQRVEAELANAQVTIKAAAFQLVERDKQLVAARGAAQAVGPAPHCTALTVQGKVQ